jgi:hypothetical protein
MIMIFHGKFRTNVGVDKTDSLNVEKLLTVKLKVACGLAVSSSSSTSLVVDFGTTFVSTSTSSRDSMVSILVGLFQAKK